MNWLKSKLSGKSEAMPSPSPSPSSPGSDSASTDESCDEMPDYCYSCSNPCDHPRIPSAIAKRIEGGSVKDSVKPYKRHFVIRVGEPDTKWPNDIEDKTGYVSEFCKLVKNYKSKLGYGIRITVTDEPTLIEGAPIVIDKDMKADVLLFPDMISFPAVTLDQVTTICDFLVKQNSIANKRVKAILSNPASASSSSSSSSSAAASAGAVYSDLDVPHSALNGTYFLVCTHKLRDKRCAVAGNLLLAEIRKQSKALEQENAPIISLPTSHIGGHKFAANVIAYPYGEWLGRATPCVVDKMLDLYVKHDESKRKDLKPLVRGRMSMDW